MRRGTRLDSLMSEGRTRLGMRWNRLKVVAGSTSGGFFVPYGYARDLEPPATPYAAIETLFRARDGLFHDHVAAMATHLPDYQGFRADDRTRFGAGRCFPPRRHPAQPDLPGAAARGWCTSTTSSCPGTIRW